MRRKKKEKKRKKKRVKEKERKKEEKGWVVFFRFFSFSFCFPPLLSKGWRNNVDPCLLVNPHF